MSSQFRRLSFLAVSVAAVQTGSSFEAGQEHLALVSVAAPDKAAAIELIQQDPAVAQGQLEARVTEYDIFLDRGMRQ